MTLHGSLEVYGSRVRNPRQAAWLANEQARAAMVGQTAGSLGDALQDPHGMTASETARLRDRFEHFMPSVAAGHAPHQRAQEFFGPILPGGATLDPNAGSGLARSMAKHAGMRRRAEGGLPSGGLLSGGGSFHSTQRPYQPEFDSPDRQNYPTHRHLANMYWRTFFKLDPIIGTCIDLYSEMVWSHFGLSGDGVDGEIKDALEYMCEETQLRAHLPYFVKEFMVVGEVAPHLFWDDDEGLWTHIALHNPDQLEIIHAPFLKMDPLIEFKPEDRLRQVLTSTNPNLAHVREMMPPEILSALVSGKNIPLSPINCTFIPRKLHPYDVRGTSIISRMWRILMYEDSIFNASIAIARRAAAPLKVAKLGDRATGWIPDQTQEKRLLELLVQAETDPAAWMVYHYGIEFDLVGSQERAWKIDQSAEFIERTKMMAMGISKAFIQGEVTYASAASGLTVFLQRLKAMREFFESVWIYPKFFRPVAEMNKWVKPTQAELSHRVRTRRSKRELREDSRYIVPKLEWDRPLDPSIDSAMIQAVTALKSLGVQFSKTTMASLVNRDYETELQQVFREAKLEQDTLAKHPELQAAMGGGAGGDAGGGGGGLSPGLPPTSMGGDMGGGDMGGGDMAAPPPEGGGEVPPVGAAAGDGTEGHGGTAGPKASIWDAEGRHGDWSKTEATDLIQVLRGELPEEEPWDRMCGEWAQAVKGGDRNAYAALRALKDGDPAEAWEAVEEWLLVGGYPPRAVRDLEAILKSEGVLTPSGPPSGLERAAKVLDNLEVSDDDRFFVGAP